jgi:hypothetical protein
MLTIILVVQCLTFLALGALFLSQGNWRLGVAQLLLLIVQGVIYS